MAFATSIAFGSFFFSKKTRARLSTPSSTDTSTALSARAAKRSSVSNCTRARAFAAEGCCP
jgi:hypothetical protein